MNTINLKIGQKLRAFRRKQNMTLADLSNCINKSIATISKYERGEIIVDIMTLYELAEAFSVNVEQLLVPNEIHQNKITPTPEPAFFSGIHQFYSYLYDGRANKIIRCVFDIVPHTSGEDTKIYMYMNFTDYSNYQDSENTYYGTIEHYDAVTNITMRNQDTYMERINICILASFLDLSTKWGLFSGLSSRPMMPISVKMLFSRQILVEDNELMEHLKISRNDIQLLRQYNMLSAI